jgi:hypothetical protein
MTLYIHRQFKLEVSKIQNMTNPLVSRGASETRISGQAELAEGIGSEVVVPAPSTDLLLPLGSGITTGRALYFESNLDMSIKIGGNEADREIVLKLPDASGAKAIVYLDAEFTSLYVTLAGTTDAEIFYAVLGS